jgi:tetratricopeptide (TPR) repeat protein
MKYAIVALLLCAGVAHAQPASTAEQLFDEGQQAYDAKQYDAALVSWQKSYELSRLPALLFNVAQAFRLRAQPGDCGKAVEHYRKFIQLDPKSSQRGTAEGFLAELAACATDVPAQPAPVSPGPEPAQPGGSTKRLTGSIVAAGSVVLFATGAYFGSKARALGNEVTEECARRCEFADIADRDAEGRSAVTKQWVFYGLGAAGLATGGVLYWLGTKERSAPVAVVPRGDGAIVTWSGAW